MINAKRSIDLAVLVTFLVLLTAVSPTSAQDTTCAALAQIRDAAKDQFQALRGPASAENQWQGKVLLPGFQACTISLLDDGNIVYVCESPAVAQDKSKADQQRVVAKLAGCLGANTPVASNEFGTTVLSTIMPEDGGPVFGVASSKSLKEQIRSGADAWSLLFQVGATTPGAAMGEEEEKEEAKPAQLPSAAEFCPKLAKVLAEAPGVFKGIRGKGDESGGWDTTLKLPGLSRCKINSLSEGRFYYSCEVSSISTREVAGIDLDGAKHLVAGCLGDQWEAQEKQRPNGGVSVSFWKGDHEPTVDLRLGPPLYRGATWKLRFDVDSPAKN